MEDSLYEQYDEAFNEENTRIGSNRRPPALRPTNDLLIYKRRISHGPESGRGRVGQDPTTEETTYESASRDWRRDFAPQLVTDCRRQAMRAVLSRNPGEAIKEYWKALEEINLCGRCMCPIKVKRQSYACSCTWQILLWQLASCQDASLMALLGDALTGAKCSCRQGAVKVKQTKYGGLPLRLPRFYYRPIKPYTYADIPSHFAIYWADETRTRLWMEFEDGTGRSIFLKRELYSVRVPAQKRHRKKSPERIDQDGMIEVNRERFRFVERLADGSEVDCEPQKSYRVYNLKCECHFRRPQMIKVDPIL